MGTAVEIHPTGDAGVFYLVTEMWRATLDTKTTKNVIREALENGNYVIFKQGYGMESNQVKEALGY